MLSWRNFSDLEPDLATLGEEIIERTGMVMLGTLRKDGSPRISPVEVLFSEGQLYLGMMWRSKKALDLLRDPRCTVHSATSNRDGSQGDFKVFGKAVPVSDLEERRRYSEAVYEKIGFKPEEPEFHLFSIDVESAALVEFKNEEMTHRVWKAD
ncbi:MAG: hypothetical protein BZY81_08005 [SAR202 cluster bacterium Io17-Chloro-G4]|nr:MAG: hypothetical protein BZY81_08005 [SAR202 cluster bacterium Io17-Chloro-G4]